MRYDDLMIPTRTGVIDLFMAVVDQVRSIDVKSQCIDKFYDDLSVPLLIRTTHVGLFKVTVITCM